VRGFFVRGTTSASDSVYFSKSLKNIQSNFALTQTTPPKVNQCQTILCPPRSNKNLLKTFSRIFYILRDILIRKIYNRTPCIYFYMKNFLPDYFCSK